MTGRVLLVALGAVGVLLGLALAAGGIVLLVLTGRDATCGGGEATLGTDRYALVTRAAGLGGGGVDATVRVRVRSTRGGPVFVGVAPAAAVDRYLAGAAYDELVDVRLSPLRATPVPSDGTRAPAPPRDGPHWTVSAPGVEVTAALSVRAPFLRRLGLGLLVAGALVAPAGGLLLAAGVWQVLRTRPPRLEPG